MQGVRTKILMRRKSALQDEIGLRIGDDGEELLDKLADLDADIETIHDKAMFREALRLGAEIVRASPGTGAERCTHSGAGSRTANGFNNQR